MRLPKLYVEVDYAGRPVWPGGYRATAYVGQVVCRDVVVAETAYTRSWRSARWAAWRLLQEREVLRRQLRLPLL